MENLEEEFKTVRQVQVIKTVTDFYSQLCIKAHRDSLQLLPIEVAGELIKEIVTDKVRELINNNMLDEVYEKIYVEMYN